VLPSKRYCSPYDIRDAGSRLFTVSSLPPTLQDSFISYSKKKRFKWNLEDRIATQKISFGGITKESPGLAASILRENKVTRMSERMRVNPWLI
jgi:hypothetical protein